VPNTRSGSRKHSVASPAIPREITQSAHTIRIPPTACSQSIKSDVPRHTSCYFLIITVLSNLSTKPHPSAFPEDIPSPVALGRLGRFRRRAGVLLAEAVVACGILTMVMVGASHAMLNARRISAASRVLTGARAVVQRDIDTALTVTFSQSSQPAILAITPSGGQVYDDDGGFDNTIQIAVQDNGTMVVAAGVLTRTVTAVANSDGADIRQITFRLDYTYQGRAESISMTTMRSIDD